MKKGLVLGKFYPFHRGHAALIDFARDRCDDLTVLICATSSENIPGQIRLAWVRDHYSLDDRIKPVLLGYDETLLPNTSVSSRDVSMQWAELLKTRFEAFDLVFSSEAYGDYLAEYLGARHVSFDPARSAIAVSATDVRNDPFKHWKHIPQTVRPYFVKKVAIIGTESTGKSTLAENLAKHFHTVFVPEMAREVIEKTIECRPEHLVEVAGLHAKAIIEGANRTNKIMFVDTDINITRSYSRFLFGEELDVAKWIDEANRCDLYLYLDSESQFIQDGTRLEKRARELLDASHRATFNGQGIEYVNIGGDWQERFRAAVAVVNRQFGLEDVANAKLTRNRPR